MTRRAWLAASLVAGIASALIAVSGGFIVSVGGVRISARSWQVSAGAAGVAALAWCWCAIRDGKLTADVDDLGRWLEVRGQTLAAALALLTLVVALGFSSFSAAGADASGYLSQAAMWARLDTRLPDNLVTLPDWPLEPGATAPLGWRPAIERGWQVPTYAPGLPWLMAPPYAAAGTTGAVLVVIASAGVAVWATGALAGGLAGGLSALFAAALIASSPTFLAHAFQPMSDVPVTAAWMVCWLLVARRAPAGAGMAAAIAVLIRPNLAPLAAVPWVVTILVGEGPNRWGRAARFALPVAIAGLAVGTLQWHWYGSPVRSGYGSTGELFAIANLGANLRVYTAWLLAAEPGFVLSLAVTAVCAGATVLGRGRGASLSRDQAARSRRTIAGGLVCFSIGVALAYFVYAVFEVWTYLRFLLPALASTAVLIGIATARAAAAPNRFGGGAAVLGLIVVVSALGVHTARRLGVFQVAAVTARARDAGDRLARILPPNAVLLAGEQSGSMRHTTRRPVVRWEGLDERDLESVLAILISHGLEPWWVLDQFEEAGVRARFPDVPAAALDWPPDVEAGPLMRTRAWRIPPIKTEAARSAP